HLVEHHAKHIVDAHAEPPGRLHRIARVSYMAHHQVRPAVRRERRGTSTRNCRSFSHFRTHALAYWRHRGILIRPHEIPFASAHAPARSPPALPSRPPCPADRRRF